MTMAVTVTTAAMAFTVAVTMMVAVNSRVVGQFIGQEIIYRCIRVTLNAAVQFNSCLSQSILGTTANAAADQSVDVFLLQEGGQGTMTGTIAGYDMGFLNRVVFNGIHLKLFCVSEMLENLTVVIGNCKLHRTVTSFLHR